MKIIVIDDEEKISMVTTNDKDAFMLKVAKRLVEKKDEVDKTLAESICHLARLGSANTQKFMPPGPLRD